MPSLIGGGNGRPKRVAVERKSKCSRCHIPFAAGDCCIAIPKLGRGFKTDMRVCDQCFERILRKTADDLEEVRAL